MVRMANQPALARADACIKCGLCQLACPVMEVDPAFAGPKALGPDWHRRLLAGEDALDETATRCTFCQLCEAACPADVPIAHLIAEHKHRGGHAGLHELRDAIVVRPDLLARVPWLARAPRRFAPLIGLSAEARWPRPRPPRRHRARSARVGIFVDCFSRGFDGGTVDALVAVLARAGIPARTLPEASRCCGAAAWASGQPRVAHRRAVHAAHALARDAAGLEAVLTVNATCQATVRGEWAEIFQIAETVPVVGAVEWLVEHGLLEEAEAASRGPLALHTTCRSTVAGVGGADAEALRRVGYEVVETGLSCCGAAGSYAFKAEHAERARAIGRRVGPPAGVAGVAVDSATCALHLWELWGLVARHPIVWIEEAQRA
jgi:glycerol-3-phosphate dehydrogenase subunit C